MFRMLGAGFLLLSGLLLGGCVFGGGDGDPPSVTRPGSIPTATPPANLPEPILLSQATPPPNTPGGTGGAAPGSYVVKSGDTLFGIAAALGVAGDAVGPWTSEVLRLNQLADGGSLRIGQELTLPVVRSPTPAPGATATRPPATGNTPAASTPAAGAPTATRAPAANATPAATSTTGASSRTYTVVAGDYPLLIAQKLNVPDAQQNAWANELLTLNGTTAATLDVGDVLRLPVSTP